MTVAEGCPVSTSSQVGPSGISRKFKYIYQYVRSNLLYSNMIVFEHMCPSVAVRIWPHHPGHTLYLDTIDF